MKQMKYKHKRALYGFGFILPWFLGFVLFFMIPVVSSLVMSLNSLSFEGNHLAYNFVGIENFRYALTRDEKFLPFFYESLVDLFVNVPIILVCSFFFSLILKDNFRGNTLMKVVFFLPVILGNGVFSIYQNDLMQIQGLSVEMMQAESSEMLGEFTSSGLISFMAEAGEPAASLNYLTIPIERIYDLMSKSGVQTFIFLSGLKAVPPSLYESARVEGCSAWDSFWKITLPMVSPMIIVNAVFTIVDSFAAEGNKLLEYIYETGFSNTNFGLSSAMAWIFFAVLAVVVSIVLWAVNRRIVYLNNGR